MKFSSEEIFETADFLRDMDYYGIDEALVYHAVAREHSPNLGNEILMKEIGTNKRFHPCWVVMPNVTDEIDRPEILISRMLEAGVRCVRIFPVEHKFSLKNWSW